MPAEECDEAIEELEDTRRRVRALSRPPPGHVSLSARLRGFAVALRNGLVVTVKYMGALPGRWEGGAGGWVSGRGGRAVVGLLSLVSLGDNRAVERRLRE